MAPSNKSLGIGVGLRPPHHIEFLQTPPSSVQWIEVISENYMEWKNGGLPKGLETLKRVRKDFPVALHGVSMNLGSADPLDLDYLARLKNLISAIDPFVVSDHLAWTGVSGTNLHDLLPLPYTQEALENLANKIDQVQNFLGRTLLVENPSSYLEYQCSEMSEPDFINELLNKTGASLLLDVNNVYVSSVNHRFDARKYIGSLPKDRIFQIHLAGHSNVDGFLIDTHDAPICDEVWSLYQWTIANIGICNVMIERDGNIPTWQDLEKELLEIRRIHELCKKTT